MKIDRLLEIITILLNKDVVSSKALAEHFKVSVRIIQRDLCVNACPVQALGEPEMKQLTCNKYAFGGENGGDWKIKCHRCRDICPYCYGKINSNMKRMEMSQ